jgi:hypothetical protein
MNKIFRTRLFDQSCRSAPPIHFLSVADPHNEDAYFGILDLGDDPKIAHALFPKFAQLGTFEGFADTAWIVQLGDTTMQKNKDTSRRLRVDPV